jgi:hypothetical protein
MVLNDTTNRTGILQACEDQTGLGALGITSNTVLFQQFVGWCNRWNKRIIRIILQAEDSWDFDDSNRTDYPSGTFTGTTNRDYSFDPTLKMLKLKTVAFSYDGINYTKARPVDTSDNDFWKVRDDPNVDNIFFSANPRYDAIASGINIYPKFTAAQVALGANVYVEFFRDAKTDFAASGTDSLEPGFDSGFHWVIATGASYEYAKLYKPDLAVQLERDIFGFKTRYGIVNPGVLDDIVEFYSYRIPQAKRIIPKQTSSR